MALNNYKILDSDIATKGVVNAPDKLVGTAQQNKAVFDRLIREVVKGYFNSVIDALTDAGGATEVGFTDINGITAQNVQSAISILKALVDTKANEAATEAELFLKSDKTTTNLHFKDVGFTESTGVFTFTREDGTTKSIDTLLEKIAVNFEYDAANQRIVLTLKDGTKQYISLSDFITEYEFQDSSTIAFSIASHVVSASIKNGSITDEMLSSALIAQLEGYVTDASTYASNASASEQNALAYRNQAQTAKTASESARDLAIAAKNSAQSDASTAVGAMNNAISAKDISVDKSLVSEGFAVGQQNGADVTPDSPYYHNNSKYFKEEAERAAGGGVTSFNERAGSVMPQSGDYTAEMVGLNNVDNTSDMDKPVSTAQQAALDLKVNPDGYYGESGGVFQYAKNLYGVLTPQNASNINFRPTASQMSGQSWSADSISGQTATIEKIKGKTLMWNQQVRPDAIFTTPSSAIGWHNNRGNVSIIDNTISVEDNRTSLSSFGVYYRLDNSIQTGHKYYVKIRNFKINETVDFRRVNINFAVASNINDGYHYINDSDFEGDVEYIAAITKEVATDYTTPITVLYVSNEAVSSPTTSSFSFDRRITIVDLTAMYGAGNEPITVEEFKAQFPLDYYAYNTGELISLNATGLKTNGFNQWDEKVHNGKFLVGTTGLESPAEDSWCSANFCDCVAGATYHGYKKNDVYAPASLNILWYDSNKNFINRVSFSDGDKTPPANARYFKLSQKDGGVYVPNSICINLSWSGIRNGEYEPYWDSTLSLPIATYFPDGMKSAGTVYDELVKDKAVKRIGKVDLGTLTWAYSSNKYFYARIQGNAIVPNSSTKPNVICSVYDRSTARAIWEDRTTDALNMIIGMENNGDGDAGRIWIKNLSYTGSASFKTAMSGVYLYYELAEPVETPISPELNLTYRCDDFGTEMLLPQNASSNMLTAPMDMEVIYGIDYEANIRNLAINYPNNSFVSALAKAFESVGINMTASNSNGSWTVTMKEITPEES